MGLLNKILVGTGISALVVGGITYLRRLNRTANELEVMPQLYLHKITLQGIVIRINVKLKNPTRTQIKMKFPFIKLLYKGTSIGSSQVVNRDIILPQYGEAVIDDIMITIPLLGVFSLANDLLKAFQSGEPVKLNVRTITTIDLGWKQHPYEDSQEITLKK